MFLSVIFVYCGMKPKEKAEELVQEMFKPNNHYLNHNIEIDRDIAINSALICVREVVTELNKLPSKDLSDLQFWGEVEYEIKNYR